MEELLTGARKIVTQCLNIKPWEKVLIVTDGKMFKIAKALYKASKEINLDTVLMVMEARGRDGAEPPEIVSKAMLSANVVIAPTFYSLTHTKARIDAGKAGVRVAVMPRVSEFSFIKGGLTADYSEIKKLTEKMFHAVKGTTSIRVTSKNGTDVSFPIEGREWKKDTGIIHKAKDISNLPAGEVYIAPLETETNGNIVFDNFELANGKLELHVENGVAKEIKGDARPLSKVFNQLGVKSRVIAEFGIGTNPKARVIGNTLEDEKVLGTCHFALGSNLGMGGMNSVEFHKDGIIKYPTVKADKKIIIEEGKWKI
jgi:leucyl aminopeptidase (aminopeptidase T)